ncbi:MAG: DNA polymerase III subunit epsilon [Gammaproteobacteria bacterium]|nr:DNA polymerase III subunit epsilon [Gammaproteobacteria bacterium]
MRQVVLDTETTGLEPAQGHRIVEIGAVEIVDRRLTRNRFHRYVHPERDIDDAAVEVHGLTLQDLDGKPRFADVVDEFLEFVRDADVVIHNAPFDVSFIDYELELLGRGPRSIAELCTITDSLKLAKDRHPGRKNNLDALCRRYGVDNSQRELHGALLDAEILADVYLLMTGGQASLFPGDDPVAGEVEEGPAFRLPVDRAALLVVRATAEERAAHEAKLDALDALCGRPCICRQPPAAGAQA